MAAQERPCIARLLDLILWLMGFSCFCLCVPTLLFVAATKSFLESDAFGEGGAPITHALLAVPRILIIALLLPMLTLPAWLPALIVANLFSTDIAIGTVFIGMFASGMGLWWRTKKLPQFLNGIRLTKHIEAIPAALYDLLALICLPLGLVTVVRLPHFSHILSEKPVRRALVLHVPFGIMDLLLTLPYLAINLSWRGAHFRKAISNFQSSQEHPAAWETTYRTIVIANTASLLVDAVSYATIIFFTCLSPWRLPKRCKDFFSVEDIDDRHDLVSVSVANCLTDWLHILLALVGCIAFYRIPSLCADMTRQGVTVDDRYKAMSNMAVMLFVDAFVLVETALVLPNPYRLYCVSKTIKQRRADITVRNTKELITIMGDATWDSVIDVPALLCLISLTAAIWGRNVLFWKKYKQETKRDTIWSQFQLLLLDIPAIIACVFIATGIFWGRLTIFVKAARADGLSHSLILEQFVCYLVDLPHLIMVLFLLTGVWGRLFIFLNAVRKEGLSHDLIGKQAALYFADIPAIIFAAIICTGLWGRAFIFARAAFKDGLSHKLISEQFGKWVGDLPFVLLFLITSCALWGRAEVMWYRVLRYALGKDDTTPAESISRMALLAFMDIPSFALAAPCLPAVYGRSQRFAKSVKNTFGDPNLTWHQCAWQHFWELLIDVLHMPAFFFVSACVWGRGCVMWSNLWAVRAETDGKRQIVRNQLREALLDIIYDLPTIIMALIAVINLPRIKQVLSAMRLADDRHERRARILRLLILLPFDVLAALCCVPLFLLPWRYKPTYRVLVEGKTMQLLPPTVDAAFLADLPADFHAVLPAAPEQEPHFLAVHIFIFKQAIFWLFDIPFVFMYLLLRISWRRDLLRGQLGGDMTDGDIRSLVTRQFLFILLDIPAVLAGLLLLFTWRHRNIRRKFYDIRKRPDHRAVAFELFQLLIDVPFVALGILSAWRLPQLLFHTQVLPSAKCSLPAARCRSLAASQLVLAIFDVPITALYAATIFVPWRFYYITRDIVRLALASCKSSASPPDEDDTYHSIVGHQFINALLDVPAMLAAAFTVVAPWQLYMLLRALSKKPKAPIARVQCGYHAARVIVDYVCLALLLCAVAIAPWRIPSVFHLLRAKVPVGGEMVPLHSSVSSSFIWSNAQIAGVKVLSRALLDWTTLLVCIPVFLLRPLAASSRIARRRSKLNAALSFKPACVLEGGDGNYEADVQSSLVAMRQYGIASAIINSHFLPAAVDARQLAEEGTRVLVIDGTRVNLLDRTAQAFVTLHLDVPWLLEPFIDILVDEYRHAQNRIIRFFRLPYRLLAQVIVVMHMPLRKFSAKLRRFSPLSESVSAVGALAIADGMPELSWVTLPVFAVATVQTLVRDLYVSLQFATFGFATLGLGWRSKHVPQRKYSHIKRTDLLTREGACMVWQLLMLPVVIYMQFVLLLLPVVLAVFILRPPTLLTDWLSFNIRHQVWVQMTPLVWVAWGIWFLLAVLPGCRRTFTVVLPRVRWWMPIVSLRWFVYRIFTRTVWKSYRKLLLKASRWSYRYRTWCGLGEVVITVVVGAWVLWPVAIPVLDHYLSGRPLNVPLFCALLVVSLILLIQAKRTTEEGWGTLDFVQTPALRLSQLLVELPGRGMIVHFAGRKDADFTFSRAALNLGGKPFWRTLYSIVRAPVRLLIRAFRSSSLPVELTPIYIDPASLGKGVTDFNLSIEFATDEEGIGKRLDTYVIVKRLTKLVDAGDPEVVFTIEYEQRKGADGKFGRGVLIKHVTRPSIILQSVDLNYSQFAGGGKSRTFATGRGRNLLSADGVEDLEAGAAGHVDVEVDVDVDVQVHGSKHDDDGFGSGSGIAMVEKPAMAEEKDDAPTRADRISFGGL